MQVLSGRAGKVPIVVIVGAVLLMLAGIGVVAFTRMKKPSNHKEPAAKAELKLWTFEEFVVNLADLTEPHYLKVCLVLGIEGEAGEGGGGGHGGEGAENAEQVKAKDCIISVLTRKRYAELLSQEGKERLKAELKSALNNRLTHAKVAEVYFTSFAMQ